MKNSIRGALAGLSLFLIAGLAAPIARGDVRAGVPGGELNPALAAVLSEYPGTQALFRSGQVVGIYGAPMDAAGTPAKAAEQWLARHADALGEPGLDLRLMRTDELSHNRFTVFAYDQLVEGLPVDLASVKVLVWNDVAAKLHRVVYVGSKLAITPVGGFLPDALDAELAMGIAKATPGFEHLDNWDPAREVVYFGEGDGLGDEAGEWITPRRAWAVSGWVNDPASSDAYTLFIDSATGQLIHARHDVAHSVTGTVTGRTNTNLLAFSDTNPASATPVAINGARVNVAGSNPHNAFTNVAGVFTTLPFVGPSTLTASLTSLAFFGIVDAADATTSAVAVVNPGDSPSLVLNAAGTEFDTSEVNAIIAIDAMRQFFLARAPGSTLLNTPLTVNVNVNATCNANFNPSTMSLNFFRSGGGCNNSAYTTVAAHEYGHYIVNQLNLAQGAFGEGFGDCCSIMLYDTGIVGDGFRTGATPGTAASYIRNPETANQQYPCSAEIHTCGQCLGGVWRETRNNLVASDGLASGLENVRQLFIDWSRVTIGGSGTNAITPGMVIEVLTLDDTDGYLGNGTPDYPEICAAFTEHGLSCPPLSTLDFSYPDGLPSLLPPSAGFNVRVDVLQVSDTLRPGTVRMFYRTGPGAFISTIPTQITPLQFSAQLPAEPCGTRVEFYFTAVGDTTGASAFGPASAPTTGFSAGSGYGLLTITDNMEFNAGWTVSGNAVTGAWELGNPQATIAQPEDDTTPTPGVNCWVTGAAAGSAAGSFDVDTGSTVLTSPVYNLSSGSGHRVSYNRWYSNSAGAGANEDVFTVDVSNNNGASWVRAETVGPTGTGTAGGWISASWNLSQFVAPTSQVRLRFTASDLINGSLVEAALDDLVIASLDCTPPPVTCLADITEVGGTAQNPGNPDGQLTVDDVILFVNLFSDGTGCPGAAPCSRCDVTGVGGASAPPDGQLSVDDVIEFFNAFADGCPA